MTSLLKKIHFVDDINGCTRAMVMSCQCTDEKPFEFYKNNVTSTDAEKAFHDTRLNRDEDTNIRLNFSNKHKDHKYVGILEENPFVDDEDDESSDSEAAKNFLDYCLATFKREQLLKRIDEAIDKNQRRVFNKLVKELNALPVPVKKFKTVKEKVLN